MSDANSRIKLDDDLRALFGPKVNIYFQPPESMKMKYPAFRYRYIGTNRKFANGKPFISNDLYEGMLIVSGSESVYSKKLLEMPYVHLDRVYTANNLTHYSYTITI